MLYRYKEVLKKYKSDYNLKKALNSNEIFKIQDGIYSDRKLINQLPVYSFKYPNAIITMDSAFYYWDLTDVIPDRVYLATIRNTRAIKDKNVCQIYIDKNIINEGKEKVIIEDQEVNIYNRERLLVELIKKRKQIPFDYYKELIVNYRELVDELDMEKIEKYIALYKNDINIFDAMQREVF